MGTDYHIIVSKNPSESGKPYIPKHTYHTHTLPRLSQSLGICPASQGSHSCSSLFKHPEESPGEERRGSQTSEIRNFQTFLAVGDVRTEESEDVREESTLVKCQNVLSPVPHPRCLTAGSSAFGYWRLSPPNPLSLWMLDSSHMELRGMGNVLWLTSSVHDQTHWERMWQCVTVSCCLTQNKVL